MTQKELIDKLINAAAAGKTEKVREILDTGADFDMQDKYGETALMWAAACGYTDTVKLLLNAGANTNLQDRDGWTALSRATVNGRVDTVKLLLDHGADVDIQDKYGQTALRQVCYDGHAETANLLLAGGADAEKTDCKGNTVLIYTCMFSRKKREIITAFIAAGTCLNTVNNEGCTALMELALRGYPGLMKLLIKAGADPDIRNNKGMNALDILKEYHPEQYDRLMQNTVMTARARALKKEDSVKTPATGFEFDI